VPDTGTVEALLGGDVAGPVVLSNSAGFAGPPASALHAHRATVIVAGFATLARLLGALF